MNTPAESTTAPSEPTLADRPLWILVLLATALGAALRFLWLDRPELWTDESCAWHFVFEASPFDFRSRPLLYENASRFYYILLAGWTALLGDSPWALRSLSALIGTLTIPLVARWLRSAAGNVPAAIAAVLTAVSPLHVNYSREARFYPLLLAEIVLLLWVAGIAATTNRRRWWSAYVLLWLAILWTHYFAVFLAPVALAIPLLQRPPRRLQRWCIANITVALFFAPWFFRVVLPVSGRGNGDWVADYFYRYPPWTAIPRTLATFGPAGFYPLQTGYLGLASRLAPWTAAVGLGVFIAAVAAFATAFRAGRSPSRRVRLFFALAVLTPLVLAWLYSMLRSPIYFVGRYDVVAWPAALFLLCVGLTDLLRPLRRIRLASLALAVLALGPPVRASMLMVEKSARAAQPQQELLTYLDREAAPGDRFVALGLARWDLCYYWPRMGPGAPPAKAELACYPASVAGQVGWFSPRRDLRRRHDLEREAAGLVARLRREMPPSSTVWMIFSGSADPAQGANDPTVQVYSILVSAAQAAGGVDRPTPPELPLLALRWSSSGGSSTRFAAPPQP